MSPKTTFNLFVLVATFLTWSALKFQKRDTAKKIPAEKSQKCFFELKFMLKNV